MGEELERGAWGSQVEFFLTMVGYAVGLGNVWRFPFLAFEHGGGAFLVPYILMLLFVGLPIFFFELCFGQFASLGPISIWTVSPIFKGLGISMVAMSWMIGLNYVIIITYAIYMFFASMTGDLPFSDCTHTWNTQYCIRAEELKTLILNGTALNITLEDLGISGVQDFTSPTEEYFYREILEFNDGVEETGTVVWQLALCLLFAWMLVFLVLINGIETLGKVVYFVATFPYVVMTIMLIRGVTLEGAGNGITFYIEPKADGLSSASAWSDAAVQIFYSLSACSGGLIAMASYNPFKNNVLRDSLIIPVINCGTSIYAGFAIFSVLGYLADAKGLEVQDVAEGGPSLVFVIYPEAIAEMPVPTLWALIFFFMLVMLGFSSLFSIVESVFVAIMDEFPGVLRKNKYRPIMFRGSCCIAFYLLCLWQVTQSGFYWVTLIDDYLSGFPLLFIGLVELLAINWVYGYSNFSQDVEMMLGRQPPLYFKFCWRFITPAILLAVIIFKCVDFNPVALPDYGYPDWGHVIGWLIVAFALWWIPAVALLTSCRTKGGFKEAIKTTPEWGPSSDKDRTGRYEPRNPEKLKNAFVNNGYVE